MADICKYTVGRQPKKVTAAQTAAQLTGSSLPPCSFLHYRMDAFRIEALDPDVIRMDIEDRDRDRDQDRLPLVPTPRSLVIPVPVVVPPRVNRRGRGPTRNAGAGRGPGRPRIHPGPVPANVQTAVRTINTALANAFQRVQTVESQANGLRRTGEELQEQLLAAQSDLEEVQRQVATVTVQRDTAQQELMQYKVDAESVRTMPLSTLSTRQAEVATIGSILGAELSRRAQQNQLEQEHPRFFMKRCSVCLDEDNAPCMVMVDCGHCLCEGCSHMLHSITGPTELFKCPECRTENTKMQKLYGLNC